MPALVSFLVLGVVERTAAETVELTLEKSLEIALRHNLSIRIAQLGQDAVETEIARARAIFHPTVGTALTASGERSVSDSCRSDCKATADPEVLTQTAAPFIRTLLPTGASVILSNEFSRQETQGATPPAEFTSGPTLTIVQPLFRGGRVYVATKPIRDAEFDTRIEGARLQAEILRVVAATKSAYYTVALAEKVIAATEAALERDRALLEASQALFRAGLVTKRDLFSAEISRAKDTGRLVSAQADLESSKITLVNVLGLSLGVEPVLLDRDIGVPEVRITLEEWIAGALRNRPEVMEIDERLKKSALNIRAARNLTLPQVDLVASYGRLQSAATFRRSLGLGGHEWTAGLVFSIPLGNVAAKATLARAQIEHRLLEQTLLQQQRTVEQEVREAVIKLRRNLERMKAFTVIADQAKGKLEVARARFALGLATNFDITDAQEDILSAETDLLKAIVDYNIALAELEARVAGPI